MRKSLTLRKGLSLKLNGSILSPDAAATVIPPAAAVSPDDFPGFQPKPEVKAGDMVKAGTPVLHDKRFPDIKIVSPAGGTVREIVRGERRHIEHVVVDVDPSAPAALPLPLPSTPAELRMVMKMSGVWAMMRQRPYDIVPDPDAEPRDIFVSLIDTAPLAADPAEVLRPRLGAMARGVKALATLTRGKVYVAVAAGSAVDFEGAVMVDVKGPHPAGNAGVIAANIAPVGKGDVIWTLDGTALAAIGQLAAGERIDHTVPVAVTGPMVKAPRVVMTLPGAAVAPLLEGNLDLAGGRPLRVISGNVLTGCDTGIDGWLRAPYRQLTVILDGSDVSEFLGWASLKPKLSLSHTFISWLLPRRVFSPDSRLNGGRRPMIMSGIYESMVPVDIMPEQLIKAMLARDIGQMEQLGAYEVAPADFGAAEFADPSKLELQRIVREALDYMRKEL